jgi:hypothetical protein
MTTFTIITLSALIGGAIAAIVAEPWIVAELYGASTPSSTPPAKPADRQ